MTTTPATPTWLAPGETVVVYTDGWTGPSSPRFANVDRVAAKSFTVTGCTERIAIDEMASKRLGSSYTGYRYRVEQAGTPTARRVLALDAVSKARGAVRSATDKALTSDLDVESRAALRAALDQLDAAAADLDAITAQSGR